MGVCVSIKNTPSCSVPESHYRTHKILLICNYILLCSSSSFIFLTLSLRLFPSLIGFFIILLHVATIAVALLSCSVSTSGSNRQYGAHMVATVMTAIFQGSVSALIFMNTEDFLKHLKSYVKEENGVVILRMAGGLSLVVFCLQWVVLMMGFKLRYHTFVEGNNGNGGGRNINNGREENLKDYPWPFQV